MKWAATKYQGFGTILGKFDSASLLGKGILKGILELQKEILFFDIHNPGTKWDTTTVRETINRNIEGTNINTLSSGEEAMISRILGNIAKNIDTEISYIILIDEPDAFLHIRWQKSYIKTIVSWLSSTYPEKNFHLIIATHSPFIISDLPKNNILVLEKGVDVTPRILEEGKNKNTFGNTTYDIVSHYMGMTQGKSTLGDFTQDILSEFVQTHKSLLGDLRKMEGELLKIQKKHEGEVTIEKQEKQIERQKEQIAKHKTDYKEILEGIGDEFLRNNLLHLFDT